jgi:hypothetical protein
MVIGYEPPVPAAGSPARVAVPFPLSVRVTPFGSVPVFVMEGAGVPEVVTVNEPALATRNEVVFALVIESD